MEGKLWKELKENKKFLEATNYSTFGMTCSLILKNKRPKVSHNDAFICYLIWYKMGFDFEQLSTFTKIKKTTMISAMERIHSILLSTLRKRWQLKSRPKPKPLPSNYPYIALLVDSTFIVAEGLRKRKSTLYAQKLESVSRHITLKSVVYMIISVIYWRKKSNSQRCLIGQYSAIVVTLVLILSWSAKMVKNPSFQSEIDRNAELGRIRVPVWEIKKIV